MWRCSPGQVICPVPSGALFQVPSNQYCHGVPSAPLTKTRSTEPSSTAPGVPRMLPPSASQAQEPSARAAPHGDAGGLMPFDGSRVDASWPEDSDGKPVPWTYAAAGWMF